MFSYSKICIHMYVDCIFYIYIIYKQMSEGSRNPHFSMGRKVPGGGTGIPGGGL